VERLIATDHLPGYIYRWINGIPRHMHVISGGVDMHLSREDDRVLPESIIEPDPDNGFQGFVSTKAELPTREAHFGLFATSVMSPFDEFHVRNVEGAYVGRLNRGRDGMYAVLIKNHQTDPKNQRFTSIPEALEYISRVISGVILLADERSQEEG
jgi:hypothetical protein